MRCREIRPESGQSVILRQPYSSYFLPEGLAPGTKATVKEHDYGTLIIDVDGVEWRISDRCIEHEMEYEIRNRWVPAKDPRVIAYYADWNAGNHQKAISFLAEANSP